MALALPGPALAGHAGIERLGQTRQRAACTRSAGHVSEIQVSFFFLLPIVF